MDKKRPQYCYFGDQNSQLFTPQFISAITKISALADSGLLTKTQAN
jgi:hypothetical protein